MAIDTLMASIDHKLIGVAHCAAYFALHIALGRVNRDGL
jgi:hypothetical protein